MPGTAYADGKLEPIAGLADTLSVVDPKAGALSKVRAPNSVISWPQILATHPNGRTAYVVETRGAPPAGVTQLKTVQDLPAGSKLTTLAINGDALSVISEADAGVNPQSVSVSKDGRWLAIASERGGGEVIVFALENGRPTRRFALTLPLMFDPEDTERYPRSLSWSPAGDWFAVNVALRRVAFFQLIRNADGDPVEVRPHGQPLAIGKRMSRGIWTADGRHFLISDINAGPGALARIIGAPGVVYSIGFDSSPAASHRIVGRAEVGGSPEGLALSQNERRVATANLERTFLPERWFLDLAPGRSHYSVDLLDFDPQTGVLTQKDRIKAEGILPEDLVFDPTGDHLAVAVFHRRKGADRRRGWLDFYTIRGGALVAEGAPVPLPRGVHDVELMR